jgi:hypothetical protein
MYYIKNSFVFNHWLLGEDAAVITYSGRHYSATSYNKPKGVTKYGEISKAGGKRYGAGRPPSTKDPLKFVKHTSEVDVQAHKRQVEDFVQVKNLNLT